jgi:hypothetical protein
LNFSHIVDDRVGICDISITEDSITSMFISNDEQLVDKLTIEKHSPSIRILEEDNDNEDNNNNQVGDDKEGEVKEDALTVDQFDEDVGNKGIADEGPKHNMGKEEDVVDIESEEAKEENKDLDVINLDTVNNEAKLEEEQPLNEGEIVNDRIKEENIIENNETVKEENIFENNDTVIEEQQVEERKEEEQKPETNAEKDIEEQQNEIREEELLE